MEVNDITFQRKPICEVKSMVFEGDFFPLKIKQNNTYFPPHPTNSTEIMIAKRNKINSIKRAICIFIYDTNSLLYDCKSK